MKSLLSWVTNTLGSGVVWDDGQVSFYEEGGLWSFGEKISVVEVGGEVENGVLAFSTVLWLPFCLQSCICDATSPMHSPRALQHSLYGAVMNVDLFYLQS